MNPVTTTFVRGFGRSRSHSPLYPGVRAGETTCADICRPCADLCNPKIHPSRTMKGMSECGWLSRREMPSLSLFCGFVLCRFRSEPPQQRREHRFRFCRKVLRQPCDIGEKDM